MILDYYITYNHINKNIYEHISSIILINID